MCEVCGVIEDLIAQAFAHRRAIIGGLHSLLLDELQGDNTNDNVVGLPIRASRFALGNTETACGRIAYAHVESASS